MIIDKEVKSVIVGMWRQGNSYEIISELAGVPVYEVKIIIADYQNQLKKNYLNDFIINLN